MVTTRWSDSENSILENVLERLLQIPEDDEVGESIAYADWEINKKFNDNPKIMLNNREISYNLIKYSYNQISSGSQPIEDRTIPKNGFIVVYSNGVGISYIISRNSDGMKLLRKMLKYSGRNEISKNTFDIESDFFVWLISKVYTGANVIETESETLGNISLDTIKGFKGDTEDLLNKVSATGESVINIISTLSFLLESKNLNQIKLDLEYRNHENIELVLTNNGTVTTSLERYQGEYEDLDEDQLLAKLYLLIYIEILPLLVQAYKTDIDNDNWNSQKNIEFLKMVAADLSQKVETRIDMLEKTNIR
ncbi:hypothetical protein [Clostridium celatum]|uniref:hypothetical protein n=1 Tax=Clostridium celatum TaxID=36834 RepID=UPI00290134B2|nr:hypothetical protein [Clostridium celatum]MDU2265217.1 hypothetical protein [Clostridium celatum]MDU6295943.1 hypothetical protein [Clostridium celatum]